MTDVGTLKWAAEKQTGAALIPLAGGVGGLLTGHGAFDVARDARHRRLELVERALALAVPPRVLPSRHGAALPRLGRQGLGLGRRRVLAVAAGAVELLEPPLHPLQVVRRNAPAPQVRQRRLHRLPETPAKALPERRAPVAG